VLPANMTDVAGMVATAMQAIRLAERIPGPEPPPPPRS
jgi:hypothetical protein